MNSNQKAKYFVDFTVSLGNCVQRHLQYIHRLLQPYVRKNFETMFDELEEIRQKLILKKFFFMPKIEKKDLFSNNFEAVFASIDNIKTHLHWLYDGRYVSSKISMKVKKYLDDNIPVEDIVYTNIHLHHEDLKEARENLKIFSLNLSKNEIQEIKDLINQIIGILFSRYRIDVAHAFINIRGILQQLNKDLETVLNNKNYVIEYLKTYNQKKFSFDEGYPLGVKTDAIKLLHNIEKSLIPYIDELKEGILIARYTNGAIKYTEITTNVINDILPALRIFCFRRFNINLLPINVYKYL